MPNPSSYKNKDEFMGACMHARKSEHPDEKHTQSVAICLSMWRNKGKKKKHSASEIVELEKQGQHYEVDESLEDFEG